MHTSVLAFNAFVSYMIGYLNEKKKKDYSLGTWEDLNLNGFTRVFLGT